MLIKPRSKVALATVAVAAAAMVVPALSGAGGPNVSGIELEAKLKGSQEVPERGDPNGKGEAQILLRKNKRRVCYFLQWSKLDGVTAAHIHKGEAGVAGPVKVTLLEESLPGNGEAEGCVKGVKKQLIKKIGKRPERWYVNAHNEEYPDGAIRGQLKPAAGTEK